MKILAAIIYLSLSIRAFAQDREIDLPHVSCLDTLGSLVADDTAWSKGLILFDSCYWEKRIDTVKTNYVIYADSTGTVKKKDSVSLQHIYETKVCNRNQGWQMKSTRNGRWLFKGQIIDVILVVEKEDK